MKSLELEIENIKIAIINSIIKNGYEISSVDNNNFQIILTKYYEQLKKMYFEKEDFNIFEKVACLLVCINKVGINNILTIEKNAQIALDVSLEQLTKYFNREINISSEMEKKIVKSLFNTRNNLNSFMAYSLILELMVKPYICEISKNNLNK